MKCAPARAMAHAMLLLWATPFWPGFSNAMELRPTPGRHVQHQRRHPAAKAFRDEVTIRDGAIGKAEPTEGPGFPGTIFSQGVAWSTTKAPPKTSLSQLPTPQDKTAVGWVVNLIELIHWASFPMGFYVAYFIFENASILATALGGSLPRVFFVTLGLLCQIFGGGISGNMMVAPFRNAFESCEASPRGQGFKVEELNNAWRRSVAYEVLFVLQTLGLGLFTMGAYGANNWTKALVGGSTAVALLGPKEPRLGLTRTVDGQQRPILPISLSLVVVFIINMIANLFANIKLFAPAMEEQVPFFSDGIVLSGWVVAITPTLLITAGGAMESCFAESPFNQWHHFIAFAILLAGLSSSLQLYQHLVGFIQG